MAIDIGIEIFVEIKQVRQDEAERFLSKEGRARVLEGCRRDKHLPSSLPIAPAELTAAPGV
jgi:hypothetical protein